MAVSGESLFESAKHNTRLSMKYFSDLYWVFYFARFFLTLCKFLIVVIWCFTFFMLSNLEVNALGGEIHIDGWTNEKELVIAALVIVAVSSYYISSLFLSVFSDAFLAMLHCLTVDYESNGIPINGPQSFHEKVNPLLEGSQGVRKRINSLI